MQEMKELFSEVFIDDFLIKVGGNEKDGKKIHFFLKRRQKL